MLTSILPSQLVQDRFLDKYYREFSDDEENKITYMDIFNEYTETIEDFIVTDLKGRMVDLDMDRFSQELK